MKTFPTNLLQAKKSNILLGSSAVMIIFSVILILLDHSVKYVLYIFGTSLIGLLYLKICFYDYKIKVTSPISVDFADYFFVACSLSVMVFNIFHNATNSINSILSILVSFFLPGWVLVRLFGIDDILRSIIGLVVVCFTVSIGISAIIYMVVAVLTKTSPPSIPLSIIYLGISLSPLLKDHFYTRKSSRKHRSAPYTKEYNLFDILILTWIVLFFAFVMSTLYPSLAYLPGSDIVRHFSNTEQLIKTPDLYGSIYPWFNFAWAMVMRLSIVPMWLFQSAIACLSIMLIFSFYLMAKAYLKRIDKRAPILATLFFFAFSGFGWFHFIQHLIYNYAHHGHFFLLALSHDATYWDIGYGQAPWLWFWFRPITIGFTILFLLLYFMEFADLGRYKYITITSFLILILSQVHLPELVIFGIFLFILGLFFPTVRLRLRDTSVSVLICLAFCLLLSISYPKLFSEYFPATDQYIFALILLDSLTLLFSFYPRRPRISFAINPAIVSSVGLFIYLTLLFHWFQNTDSLSIKSVQDTFAVPWELYPVLLGLTGVFAIPGIVFVVKKYRSEPVVIFAIFFIFVIFFGRAITYINSYFEYTDYWERRLIPYVYASVSILSPIIILKLMDYLEQKKNTLKNFKPLHDILILASLSLLVLAGVSSTFLSIEFRIENAQKYALTNNEKTLLNSLTTISPRSSLLTITQRSSDVTEFTNLGYNVGYYKYQLWPDKYPELPLRVLSILNGSATIYLSPYDISQLAKNDYKNGYIASHLLRIAPLIKQGANVGQVLETQRLTPPVSNSDTVLVLPERGIESSYYVYDILSRVGYNYTTAIQSDINTLRKAKIIVAPTEEIASKIISYRIAYNLKYDKLIVFNLDASNSPSPTSFLGYDRFIHATSIRWPQTNKEIPLPTTDVDLYPIVPTLKNYNIEAYYYDGNRRVPFILHNTYRNVDVFYFNVSPIIHKMNLDSDYAKQIYPLFGKLLEFQHIKLPYYKPLTLNINSLVNGGVAAFKMAIFRGDLNLKSSSAIIDVRNHPFIVNIDGEKKLKISDVSHIIPVSIDNATIRSNAAVIDNGSGFYAHASLNQSSISLTGHPAIVSLIYTNRTNSTVIGKKIQIDLPNPNVLLREPEIRFYGIADFANFYAYGNLYNKMRTEGQDLREDGKVVFNIPYSDKFSITSGASFEGETIRSPPVYNYNELGNLYNIFGLPNMSHILPLLIVFFAFGYYFYRKSW